jgi:hypothetical protein
MWTRSTVVRSRANATPSRSAACIRDAGDATSIGRRCTSTSSTVSSSGSARSVAVVSTVNLARPRSARARSRHWRAALLISG